MFHKRPRMLVVAAIVGAAAAVGVVSPAQAHNACATESGQFCVYNYALSEGPVAHWGAGDTNLNYAGDFYHDYGGGALNDTVSRARNTSGSTYMALWEHSWNSGRAVCVRPGENVSFNAHWFNNIASSHAAVRSVYC